MRPIRLMIPGFLIVAATYGFARYTYGPFLDMIKNDFDLGHQMAGWIGGLPYLAYMAGTMIAIWSIKRIGMKKPIIIGGCLAVIGLFMVMVAFSVPPLLAGIIVGGASGGFVWTALPLAVTRLIDEPEQQSQVIAFMNAGPALAIFLTGPMTLALGTHWRLIWGVFSVLSLVSLIWIYRILPESQLKMKKNAWQANTKKMTLLRRGKSFFTASVISGMGTGVYVTYAVNLIQDLPISLPVLNKFPQLFISFVGLISLASVLTGAVLKKVSFNRFYIMTTSVLAVSVILLPLAHHWTILVISAVLFGLTFFTYFALLVLWGLRLFQNQASEANGIMLLLISLGQFLSPVIVGYLLTFFLLSTLFVFASLLLTSLVILNPVEAKATKIRLGRKRIYQHIKNRTVNAK